MCASRRAVCRRVAQGEALLSICRDPDMPHRVTVDRWARTIPAFARRLALARQAAGWAYEASPGVQYCEDAALEIFARLCEGEPLGRICRDAHLPATSTVDRWRAHVPEFDQMMQVARTIQGERLCERSWEIAEAVTPENAYASRVKLEHARWLVPVMAPRRFARPKPLDIDELEGIERGGMTVIVRKFTEPPESLEGLAAEVKASYRGER